MTRIQLSDAQAVILSTACARGDGMVFPVTTGLKGGAVGNVCKSLLKRGLIEEVAATDLEHGLAPRRGTRPDHPARHAAGLQHPRDHRGSGRTTGWPAGGRTRPADRPPPQRHQAGGADRDAARRGRRHHRRDRRSHRLATAHREGRHFRRAEEEARPRPSPPRRSTGGSGVPHHGRLTVRPNGRSAAVLLGGGYSGQRWQAINMTAHAQNDANASIAGASTPTRFRLAYGSSACSPNLQMVSNTASHADSGIDHDRSATQ